jgi:hypothetical protein
MGDFNYETVLRYKASGIGNRTIFHKICDGIGPTITLMSTETGLCIGGYTSAQWSSPKEGIYKSDKDAMLFNLTFEECYPCKNYEHAIYCSEKFGPRFGFRELGRGYSYANKKAFQIPE